MAPNCPKCQIELPRQVVRKGFKLGSLEKAEIGCPRCQQVLRITPNRAVTIMTVAMLLAAVPIALVAILFLTPPRMDLAGTLFILILYPLTYSALLLVFYLKLARFHEKRSPYFIMG